jgi:hypothetical protein
MGNLRTLSVIAVFIALCGTAVAQTPGIVRGQVADESGAVIPGATVAVSTKAGVVKSVTTGADGTYIVNGLADGTYTVVASSPGLKQPQPVTVEVSAGTPKTVNLILLVTLEKQEVTVQGEGDRPTVSLEASNNASSLVLRKEDLDALSDDPDDLQQDLQALAGPAAGPDGSQIYIDGFTGGRLPPKESIREIRINQNPFSSEYDKLGYGRIEILTKPGTDLFHGSVFFNTSQMFLDSRNPFLQTPQTPNFSTMQYGGNVGGPLGKKASFFLDFERRNINDDNILFDSALQEALTALPNYPLVTNGVSQFLATPQTRTTLSPRIDYQLNTNNTLTFRYTWLDNNQSNRGLNTTTLPSAAYNQGDVQSTAQITETAVLNTSTINETHFQYWHEVTAAAALNTLPQLVVSSAFTVGGAPGGSSAETDNHYEIQNYTSMTKGRHTLKFGVRLRALTESSISPSGFNGSFIFSGVPGTPGVPGTLTSIQQFQLAQMGQALPTEFTLTTGTPNASIWSLDAGPFIQDDWKLRPNLTVSLGLRWEAQNHVSDWSDFAPRLGFAWSPGATKAGARPSLVIRGGSGIFYTRFSTENSLNAERYNGIIEQSWVVRNPPVFSLGPLTAAEIDANLAQAEPVNTTAVSPNLRAPYIIQSALGADRQLGKFTTLSVNYMNSHGDHLLLENDVNAPLPGTYNPEVPGSGVRPIAGKGDIYEYESAGVLNQNQIFVNVNSRLSSNLTLFGYYVYNRAFSDTDGAGYSPANPYDIAADYGPASYDIHHRVFFSGSANLRWNIRISPFLMWSSGAPFSLTTGQDLYGDNQFNARPAPAAPGAPGAIDTPYGWLNPNPLPGEATIGRNSAIGPDQFSLNLRVSKTFGFGGERAGAGGMRGGGGGGGGRGGPMGGGPAGASFRNVFGDSTTSQRYNLTVGIMARNVLNHLNLAPPIGVITSPFFGESTAMAGGYGASNAVDRRVELQARFSF